jgi:energy-coupling factor transporter transmembrane protein EcfT
MESRAWGAIEKRTNLYTLRIRKADYLLIAASVSILMIGAYVWIYVPIPSITQFLGL